MSVLRCSIMVGGGVDYVALTEGFKTKRETKKATRERDEEAEEKEKGRGGGGGGRSARTDGPGMVE